MAITHHRKGTSLRHLVHVLNLELGCSQDTVLQGALVLEARWAGDRMEAWLVVSHREVPAEVVEAHLIACEESLRAAIDRRYGRLLNRAAWVFAAPEWRSAA